MPADPKLKRAVATVQAWCYENGHTRLAAELDFIVAEPVAPTAPTPSWTVERDRWAAGERFQHAFYSGKANRAADYDSHCLVCGNPLNNHDYVGRAARKDTPDAS
jgi:hypothetical protein